MQLADNVWIAGAYYIDRSLHGELRVVGPHNHLHYGAVGFMPSDFEIDAVEEVGGALRIEGSLQLRQPFLPDPAMGHIRWVRQFIEPDGKQGKSAPTFAQVTASKPAALAPMQVSMSDSLEGPVIVYRRMYGKHWYGASLSLPPGEKLIRKAGGYEVVGGPGWLPFTLIADTTDRIQSSLGRVVRPAHSTSSSRQQRFEQKILDRTAVEITHLVSTNKTAGFGYGTVFPRDWMESADLGEYDLSPEAVQYMYRKSLEHIGADGSGWHEDVVGEFATMRREEMKALGSALGEVATGSNGVTQLQNHLQRLPERDVTRGMIDIEPRYILGLQHLRWSKLEPAVQDHLRRVASYLLDQAEANQLMIFKPLSIWEQRFRGSEYGHAGNWRDSVRAFRQIHPVIAPYDVNAVFYPEALRLIAHNAERLKVDASRAKLLHQRWSKVPDLFRFTNADGLPAFALALYDVQPDGDGVQFRRLEVNHLDEAYALFYGQPLPGDVRSFAERLLNPDYFYTASGPTLVGLRDAGYDTTHYHGQVTWTKQTAYAVAGLSRQLTRADLDAATKRLVKKALVATARASLHAFRKLGAVPELHYDAGGEPQHYNQQPLAEGPSNTVQLWSAVGARRIIRAYNEATKHA